MPTRQERSAGVIVFTITSGGDRQYLLLDYGKHWDFPKGHVDKGETDQEAALRELKEETGIAVEGLLPEFQKEIAYFFRDRSKALIRKTVVFYLAQIETKQVVLSPEHVGFDFLPFDEALARVTYPTAKQILRDAEAFLSTSSHAHDPSTPGAHPSI